MSFLGRSKDLLTWQPPTVGSRCHAISLTSDDGTWVKLEDFRGHLNVVFVVIDSLTCPDVPSWLASWSEALPQFEAAETLVFGINTARTDDLRGFRESNGIAFHLLYDPLAIECRAMRCSSRVLPMCKNTVVAVDKDGVVLHSARGHVGPAEPALLAPSEAPAEPTPEETTTSAAPQASVENIDSDKAEELIKQDGGNYIIDVRTQSSTGGQVPRGAHTDRRVAGYKELSRPTASSVCAKQAGAPRLLQAPYQHRRNGKFSRERRNERVVGERVTGGQLQS